jgi:hypothetical protein
VSCDTAAILTLARVAETPVEWPGAIMGAFGFMAAAVVGYAFCKYVLAKSV